MHEASGRNILSSQVWLVTTSGPYRKAAHDQKLRIRIRTGYSQDPPVILAFLVMDKY